MSESSMVAAPTSASFTSFLMPCWGEGEEHAITNWLAGDTYDDAVASLEVLVSRDFGNGWTARAVNLGRSAIQAALEAMRLRPEEEVILPSFACVGMVAPVIRAGLRPVFVDADERFNVRFESVVEAASSRTRVIILPHMSGLFAGDTLAIAEWAKSRSIYVIEDCAQAQGLVVDGRLAGSFGDAAVFSSHGGKIIAGPGGGWVVSQHPELGPILAEREFSPEPRGSVHARVAAFIRGCGAPAAGSVVERLRELIADDGNPARSLSLPESVRLSPSSTPQAMSELEARLLLLQRPRLKGFVVARRQNAARWRELLKALDLPGLLLLPDEDNVHTKMLLAFDGDRGIAIARSCRQLLWEAGVEAEQSYTPLHLRAPYSRFRRTSMPVTERLWPTVFAVPVRPNLNEEDWERIERAVRKMTEQSGHAP